MTVDAAPRAGRREWVGLAVLALPTLLVSIDVYVMLLALPTLSEDLHASSVQQLWITDIYGFLLAGSLVTMGTVGDRVGRKKLLLLGAAAFGVASVVAATANSPATLIAARALLGIAGATLAPSTLALISNMFRDDKQRGMAIGVWLMCFSAGAIIGPLVGGAMLAHFWWGSVFLLGVPAMALLLALAPFLLPEYKAPQAGRLDLVSVALSFAAVLPAVYGLKELARNGWAALPIVAVLAGLTLGWLFVHRQRSLTSPLLDLRLFSDRNFSVALTSMLFGTMLMGAIMLFITQHFQLVDGLSPLRTGLWMLPAVVANTISFMVSPLLGRKYRPAFLIGAGLTISVAGLLVMTQVKADAGPLALAAGFALIFLGAGPLVTLGTGLVLGAAPPEKAGSAAALNETSGQLGFAFGVAALGSIGTAIYRNQISEHLPAGLPAGAADTARDTIVGATTAAASLPQQLANELLVPAREAFTTGLHAAAGISAVILAIVAVTITRLLRQVPPTGSAPAGPAPEVAEATEATETAEPAEALEPAST